MKRTIFNLRKNLKNTDNKRLVLNLLLTYIVKGGAIIISTIMTPAYIAYFDNNAVLGVWFTIVSVLNWIIMFDFGIGNGLRNKLVEAFADNDSVSAKKYISSAYTIIGALSALVFVIGMLFIGIIDCNEVLRIDAGLVDENVLKFVLRLMLFGILLNFVLKLVTSVFFAMQRTALSNIIALLSSILLLLYLVSFKSGSLSDRLLHLSIAQVVAINLPTLIATIYLFCGSFRTLAPSLKCFQSMYARQVLSLGGNYFIIQLALLAINSTNELAITWLYSSEAVVEYQIYSKVFFLIVTLMTLVTQPVWSDVAKAHNEGNRKRIAKLYKHINVFSGLCIAITFLVFVGFQWIVDIWLGNNAITVKPFYSLAFFILVSFQILVNAATTIANGVARLKCQMIFCTLAAILKFPVTILLTNITSGWISVVLASVFIYTPLLIVQNYDIKHYLS